MSMVDTLQEILKNEKIVGPLRHQADIIFCANGARVSVQASSHRYCSPQDDKGPYTHVEVSLDHCQDIHTLWLQYHIDSNVYGWVPIQLVADLISANGGIQNKGVG